MNKHLIIIDDLIYIVQKDCQWYNIIMKYLPNIQPLLSQIKDSCPNEHKDTCCMRWWLNDYSPIENDIIKKCLNDRSLVLFYIRYNSPRNSLNMNKIFRTIINAILFEELTWVEKQAKTG
jgi:hypothetical protein